MNDVLDLLYRRAQSELAASSGRAIIPQGGGGWATPLPAAAGHGPRHQSQPETDTRTP